MKARAQNTTRTTKDVPPLTDARLVALLRHITADRDDDENGRLQGRFAYAHHAAASLLSSQPLTSAFENWRGRPDVYGLIMTGVRRDMQHWGDPAESRRSLRAMERAYERGADEATPVSAGDVNCTLVSIQEEALMLGACLMYRLMGGAR